MKTNTLTQLIEKEIKKIEAWQGDCYQTFDEVGRALHEIKILCQQADYEFVDDMPEIKDIIIK